VFAMPVLETLENVVKDQRTSAPDP